MESLYGCRYSCLVDLPYFDAPRMLSIDPMHNLFLGTGKHMISVWIEQKIISRDHFHDIQALIDNMTVPSDIGRIPSKLESGFAGFKADRFYQPLTNRPVNVHYYLKASYNNVVNDSQCSLLLAYVSWLLWNAAKSHL